MHVEVRLEKGRRLYYLAHSYRERGKVKKSRKYLGADLSEGKIEELRVHAEKAIRAEIESRTRIRDPFKSVLSPHEEEVLKSLIERVDVRVTHLSEEDWLHFTEVFTYDTNAIEGSTVTASEVQGIIEKDRWPGEKSRGEIAETYGIAEAVAYIRKTKTHLSLDLMRKLHEIAFKNSMEYAGDFRSKGVEVVVTDGRGNIRPLA